MTPPAFLAAVLGRPGDDAPRLASADWLDEHAADLPDPRAARDRAELIRAQCELARWQPGKRGLYEKQQRERELLDGHADQWFPVPPAHGLNWHIGVAASPGRPGYTVRRGFVASVRCTLADWTTHAPALLAAHPLERVEAADVPGLVWEVASGDNARMLYAHPWALVATLSGRLGPVGLPVAIRIATFPDRALLASECGRIIADQAAEMEAAAGDRWPGRIGVADRLPRDGWRAEPRERPVTHPTLDLPAYDVLRECLLYLEADPEMGRVPAGAEFGPVEAMTARGQPVWVPRAVVTACRLDAERDLIPVEARSVGDFRVGRPNPLRRPAPR
jgi:uncharacterized protein (TIGR02996 family)